MSIVDLSRLPPPDVVERLDFDTLLAERKQSLISQYPADQQEAIRRTLELESEPIVKLLRENTYRELILRQRINEAAHAVMLPYARRQDLDVIAANLNTQRKLIQPANPNATPPVAAVTEDDDALRTRAQLAFEGLSVAGPRGAYEYHALSADPRVADVKASSPAPCDVVVSILAHTGDGTAPADLVAAVAARLNDENVRPVADRLTVQSARIVPYTVAATLYLYPGPEAEPIRRTAEAALQAYVGKQHRIGRDIRRSAIFAALHVEGVQRVELAQPAADLVLSLEQASYCSAYTLNIGGSDE